MGSSTCCVGGLLLLLLRLRVRVLGGVGGAEEAGLLVLARQALRLHLLAPPLERRLVRRVQVLPGMRAGRWGD